MYPKDYPDDGMPHTKTTHTTATLDLTVFDETSGERLKDCRVWFYWCAQNGTCGTVGYDLTNTDGVASVPWAYPDDGCVYVFWACVNDAQQIVSSPVTLTVGKTTRLSMNVEQGEGFNYTFSGWLLCDGSPVDHEPIEVKVNGTSLGYVETGPDGGYSFWISLQPAENNPTSYQIELIYHGSNALNLTALATTPDGTEYAVCTTIQYFSYKPTSNTTWLTVEPQSTQVMMSTKTPEEMQAEAEDEGWLSIWHELSWWYPWHTLH